MPSKGLYCEVLSSLHYRRFLIKRQPRLDPATLKPMGGEVRFSQILALLIIVLATGTAAKGEEQQDTSWFECKSSSENMSKLIKLYVKDKMGLFVRGIPKAKAYTTSSGTAEANIEVLVTEFNILTYPKEKTDTTEQSNGRYKIESGTKAVMPEAEIYDDEIPF